MAVLLRWYVCNIICLPMSWHNAAIFIQISSFLVIRYLGQRSWSSLIKWPAIWQTLNRNDNRKHNRTLPKGVLKSCMSGSWKHIANTTCLFDFSEPLKLWCINYLDKIFLQGNRSMHWIHKGTSSIRSSHLVAQLRGNNLSKYSLSIPPIPPPNRGRDNHVLSL